MASMSTRVHTRPQPSKAIGSQCHWLPLRRQRSVFFERQAEAFGLPLIFDFVGDPFAQHRIGYLVNQIFHLGHSRSTPAFRSARLNLVSAIGSLLPPAYELVEHRDGEVDHAVTR